MLKNRNNMNAFMLVTLLAGALIISATAAEKPSIRPGRERVIEVIKVNPSKGDLRNIRIKRQREGGDQAQEPEVHVVKLHVRMPPARAEGHVLFVGETKVNAYGPFPEGIFFKVYDPKDLAALRGKPIRFVL